MEKKMVLVKTQFARMVGSITALQNVVSANMSIVRICFG